MKHLIFLIILSQAITHSAFACTDDEEEKIQMARDYIYVNANDVLSYLNNNVRWDISPRKEQRYLLKVRNSRVKCIYNRNRCNRQRGRSFGRLINSVSICPYKLENTCELISVLAHEFAHAAGFNIGNIRSHNRLENREYDLIFALEDRYKFICEQSQNLN